MYTHEQAILVLYKGARIRAVAAGVFALLALGAALVLTEWALGMMLGTMLATMAVVSGRAAHSCLVKARGVGSGKSVVPVPQVFAVQRVVNTAEATPREATFVEQLILVSILAMMVLFVTISSYAVVLRYVEEQTLKMQTHP